MTMTMKMIVDNNGNYNGDDDGDDNGNDNDDDNHDDNCDDRAMKMKKIMAMRTPMKTWQVSALEDIRTGEEVTTRYGGLNIGQVNRPSTAEKWDICE